MLPSHETFSTMISKLISYLRGLHFNKLTLYRWHTTSTPPPSKTKAVTHVMMSFANSSVFADLPAPEYKPFRPLNEVRKLFDHKVNICLAVGGWGDNTGFNAGVQTDLSIVKFAKSVANTLDKFGFDCVGGYI